jgi:hypothetical protein
MKHCPLLAQNWRRKKYGANILSLKMLPPAPRRGFILALSVLLLLTGRAAQARQPGPGSARLSNPMWTASGTPRGASILPYAYSSPRQQPPEASLGSLPVFEFHSGFWINLHHFLYQQARLRRRPAAEVPDSSDALTRDEQQAWAAALDYYASDLSHRDLLLNSDMVNINNRLAEMEACADLSGRSSRECASGLRQEHIAALERAAPVYRARWWPNHDQSNRTWIALVGPMVRQFGAELARQLAATYQAEWPTRRLRVDVVFYGGPFGAYTSLDPAHLTISSSDPRNQGYAALEVLFHEASHTLARAVRDAIVRECRARSKPIPRDLWHALLFYTTGEIVKRALNVPDRSAASNPGSYTPYAYRYGLYARGWNHYQRVLERYWQPYLDGKADFDAAVARLVSAL